MTLGERVRARRTELKLTQEQLAKMAHVTRSAISQIESGLTKGPKPEHLLRIARALAMPVETLVEGDVSRAAERAATYNLLTAPERMLIDYIRATGQDEAQRERLARVALQLLLAIGAQAVPDEQLEPKWSASSN